MPEVPRKGKGGKRVSAWQARAIEVLKKLEYSTEIYQISTGKLIGRECPICGAGEKYDSHRHGCALDELLKETTP